MFYDMVTFLHPGSMLVWLRCQLGSDLVIMQRLLTALESQTHSVATLRTHPDQVTHCLHHG